MLLQAAHAALVHSELAHAEREVACRPEAHLGVEAQQQLLHQVLHVLVLLSRVRGSRVRAKGCEDGEVE